MNDNVLMILLADDDSDDCLLFRDALSCLLFRDALSELAVSTQLTTVHNGEQLMQLLNKNEPVPDILFLDLNMPRKNGFDCLVEIKQNEKLKTLPVITISTSFEQEAVSRLYKNGAQHYIRKPSEFSRLKNMIQHAITLTTNANTVQPLKEHFVLSGEV
jgi:CheY-like chemotaxis protein